MRCSKQAVFSKKALLTTMGLFALLAAGCVQTTAATVRTEPFSINQCINTYVVESTAEEVLFDRQGRIPQPAYYVSATILPEPVMQFLLSHKEAIKSNTRDTILNKDFLQLVQQHTIENCKRFYVLLAITPLGPNPTPTLEQAKFIVDDTPGAENLPKHIYFVKGRTVNNGEKIAKTELDFRILGMDLFKELASAKIHPTVDLIVVEDSLNEDWPPTNLSLIIPALKQSPTQGMFLPDKIWHAQMNIPVGAYFPMTLYHDNKTGETNYSPVWRAITNQAGRVKKNYKDSSEGAPFANPSTIASVYNDVLQFEDGNPDQASKVIYRFILPIYEQEIAKTRTSHAPQLIP